ncbi:MAG: MFS transporter [Rhodospirillales bacterium]|nr:MFS transporter [Rhodospirillales bacterium]
MARLRDTRVNLLIATGHFLSHFYMLCLPPLFVAWQESFHVGYAALGLAVALLSAVTAILQTPVGFLVDRFGARAFLIGGASLMTLSIAAMGLAGAYWQVLVLAVLSGIGNSVIHPCDYAILSASVSRQRVGRAFSLHTFAGNVGFAAGPPVIVGLSVLLGWRGALGVVGLVGLPLVASILWQSKILVDRPAEALPQGTAKLSGKALLLTQAMLLFLVFYVFTSMATTGLQAWLITVLHKVRGMDIPLASSVLTAYLIGVSGGVLFGGWVSDRTTHHLRLVASLTVPAALLFLAVALLALPTPLDILCVFSAGVLFGTSRTPRDMMVKTASPPGQVGTVFGFVSAGLPLGSALTPVPFGFLIGAGHPELVLVLVAAIMASSVLVAAAAHGSARQREVAVAAE